MTGFTMTCRANTRVFPTQQPCIDHRWMLAHQRDNHCTKYVRDPICSAPLRQIRDPARFVLDRCQRSCRFCFVQVLLRALGPAITIDCTFCAGSSQPVLHHKCTCDHFRNANHQTIYYIKPSTHSGSTSPEIGSTHE
eukprot:SAG31_NODE_25241_length_465_cov_0.980874_1_plen_137_part_00